MFHTVPYWILVSERNGLNRVGCLDVFDKCLKSKTRVNLLRIQNVCDTESEVTWLIWCAISLFIREKFTSINKSEWLPADGEKINGR